MNACRPDMMSGSASTQTDRSGLFAKVDKEIVHRQIYPLNAPVHYWYVFNTRFLLLRPQTWPYTVNLGNDSGNQMMWSHH